MKKRIEPYIRGDQRGIGDISEAKGSSIPVQPEDVQAMVDLLLETIPVEYWTWKTLPIGFKEKKTPTVKIKIVNRITHRTNARIGPRYDGSGLGHPWFLITIYRPGLNVKTIIHEVAHIPSYGNQHGEEFKNWQRHLQYIWFSGGTK